MNILAIRFARFGDIALLLPSLLRLKSSFPDRRLTLLTGDPCAPLARICPALDDVISIDRLALKAGRPHNALRHIYRLVADIRRRRFDTVVDFHGLRETGLLSWLSGAPCRVGFRRSGKSSLDFCYTLPPVIEDKTLHVSQVFSKVADQVNGFSRSHAVDDEVPDPILSVPDADRAWWRRERAACGDPPYIALNIDAPVRERIWPPDRFAALGDAMIERCGAHVVVLAGPGNSGLVRQYLELTRFPERTTGIADLSISRLAMIIHSARVFVSNDTGPMHLGALVHTPTLGLFSVGLPEHFRPIGPYGGFLRANPISALEVAEVFERTEALWATAGSGLRR